MIHEAHLLDCLTAHAPSVADVTRLRSRLWAVWGASIGSTTRAPRTQHRTQSDIALLRAAQKGDATALDTLIARYLPKLVGYARKHLGDEAEDVVHAAMLQFFRKVKTLQMRDDRVEPMLFKFTRDAMVDAQRAWMRRQKIEPPPAPADMSLLNRVALTEVAKALAAVCDPLAQTVVLRASRGESNVEIAAALDLNANHIGVIKHRAMEALRRHFES